MFPSFRVARALSLIDTFFQPTCRLTLTQDDYGGCVTSPLAGVVRCHDFIEYGGRLNSNWVNDVTLSVNEWQPGVCGPHLSQPVLMLVSPQDEMARAVPRVTRAVFDSMRCPKEWYEVAGGHFGLLYHPSELFSEASAAQISFLRRWIEHGAPARPSEPKAQDQPGLRSIDQGARDRLAVGGQRSSAAGAAADGLRRSS